MVTLDNIKSIQGEEGVHCAFDLHYFREEFTAAKAYEKYLKHTDEHGKLKTGFVLKYLEGEYTLTAGIEHT